MSRRKGERLFPPLPQKTIELVEGSTVTDSTATDVFEMLDDSSKLESWSWHIAGIQIAADDGASDDVPALEDLRRELRRLRAILPHQVSEELGAVIVSSLRIGVLATLCDLELDALAGGKVRRGGRAGAAVVNQDAAAKREDWREAASRVWARDPKLSTRKVALEIAPYEDENARKAIADLKPKAG